MQWCLRLGWFWLVWGLFGLAALPGRSAESHDQPADSVVLRSVAILEDPSGRMGLAEAQAASAWQPAPTTVVRGFTAAALWLRLEVDPQVMGHQWFLRVRPSYLDDVRAYLPGPDGQWQERRSGDTVPADRHETTDPVITFVWTPPMPLPSRYVYLRVQTTSIMAVNVALLDRAQYDHARDQHQAVAGVLVGLMLAALGWAAFHATRRRNALFALYLAYLLSSLCFAVGILGHVGRYLTPHSTFADGFTSLMAITAALTGTIFHRAFLRSFGVRTRVLWLLAAAIVITVINLALLAAGFTREALASNAYLVLIYTALVLPAVIVSLWRHVDQANRQLLVMYSVVPASIALTILPMLGLLPAGAWSAYSGSIYALITGVALAGVMALLQRRNEEAVQTSIAQAAAARAEAAVVRAERDDKDRFLGMLAHELRTPLSVIRMVLDMGAAASPRQPVDANRRLTAHARQAIDDINGVIERAVQADRLERGDISQQRTECSVPEILGLVVHNHLQGARVQTQVPAGLPTIQSDAVLVRTMLFNLIDNALKYSPAGSVVQAQVQPRSEQGREGVAVRVSNRVGSAGKPDAQQVFGKYYRSNGAQRVGGSGLGLYLIAGLARMVGGFVILSEDASHDEVVFELWLPR